jgi:hypothetical protein
LPVLAEVLLVEKARVASTLLFQVELELGVLPEVCACDAARRSS